MQNKAEGGGKNYVETERILQPTQNQGYFLTRTYG